MMKAVCKSVRVLLVLTNVAKNSCCQSHLSWLTLPSIRLLRRCCFGWPGRQDAHLLLFVCSFGWSCLRGLPTGGAVLPYVCILLLGGLCLRPLLSLFCGKLTSAIKVGHGACESCSEVVVPKQEVARHLPQGDLCSVPRSSCSKIGDRQTQERYGNAGGGVDRNRFGCSISMKLRLK
jgi:hypothetical protein